MGSSARVRQIRLITFLFGVILTRMLQPGRVGSSGNIQGKRINIPAECCCPPKRSRVAPSQGHDFVRGQASVSTAGQTFDQLSASPRLAQALQQLQAVRGGFEFHLGMRKESVLFAQRQWNGHLSLCRYFHSRPFNSYFSKKYSFKKWAASSKAHAGPCVWTRVRGPVPLGGW